MEVIARDLEYGKVLKMLSFTFFDILNLLMLRFLKCVERIVITDFQGKIDFTTNPQPN